MEVPKLQPNRAQLVNALRNTAQSASNMVAENLSVPIDAIAWALRKTGLPVDKPMFGSDWLKEKGVTPTVPEGAAKVIGDTIGMVSPLGLTKAGSQAMIEGAKKLKGLPVGMSIKDVSGPQSQALMLAQQRAALPVEQGGLGLAAGNTPAERAAAMGFTDDVYHGGNPNVQKFMPKANQEGSEQFLQKYRDKLAKNEPVGYMDFRDGTFMSPNAEIASSYARDFGAVYPLVKNSSMPLNLDVSGMRPQVIGAKPTGTIDEMNLYRNGNLDEISIIDPDQIRSRFAAFDPFRKTATTAALYGVAAPDLLAQERDK